MKTCQKSHPILKMFEILCMWKNCRDNTWEISTIIKASINSQDKRTFLFGFLDCKNIYNNLNSEMQNIWQCIVKN